jgi:sialic acid synthase SpsE
MRIGNKVIGQEPYVIAEFGVNHNGSLDRALEGIEKAAWAGADAIKFQTYTADELVVKGTPKFWKSEGGDVGNDQYEAYAHLGGFPYENYPILIEHCEKHGIEFLSTPFSIEAADFLNSLGMKAFKIASSDMMTLPFLEHIAKFNKPILLSTGASTLEEVREAVKTIEKTGTEQIVIMQCTLKYPTPPEYANLNVLQTYKRIFGDYVIGLSDHTLGSLPSIIGCALGAQVIEKHFTVDKTLGESADHWLSVDPQELKEIVDGCKLVHKLRGMGEKLVSLVEKETRELDKRSLVSACDIPEGTIITREMVTFKRPGTGIEPKKMNMIIGKRAYRFIHNDTIFQWTDFQKQSA